MSTSSALSVEWRLIPSWPRYRVSSFGGIKNAATGYSLTLRSSETGHLYFVPVRGRKAYAHVAVLEAFVGPRPTPTHEARHLDGIPYHNDVANLAWGTKLENARDRVRHGTQPRGESAGTAKLTESQVREIRRRVGTLSLRQLALEYGVSHTAIRRAANGTKWSHVK